MTARFPVHTPETAVGKAGDLGEITARSGSSPNLVAGRNPEALAATA